MAPRWRSLHVKRSPRAMAAASSDRTWSRAGIVFGFFRPPHRAAGVLEPAAWRSSLLGIHQTIFDGWGLRHTGLFTFAQTPNT